MAGLIDFFGMLQNPEQADIRAIDNQIAQAQMPVQADIRRIDNQLAAAQGPAYQESQPQPPVQQDGGIFGSIKNYLGDEENRARLALGFNSMRMNPDQGLASFLSSRIKDVREQAIAEKSKNKTIEAMQQMGMDPAELKLLAENPELLKVAATAMYKKRYGGDITADIQNWNMLTKDLSPADEAKARRIKLGLEARAGLPDSVYFGRGYSQEAGTQAGKFEAETVKQQEAFRILRSQIDFGFDNLGTALGATGQTGKIFGNLPALTTSAQLADQAKAILLPVMKGVWRSAGEGVFTDKDQEALEAMFPTRDMTPEAARQALMAVRQMTELKLQNPKFDISAFGNALQYRGAPAATAPVAAPAPTPSAAPAASAAPQMLNGGNATRGKRGSIIVQVEK